MSNHDHYDHPYNDGYTHEVVHALSIIMEIFESRVIDTRTASEFPDVKAKAEQIASDLGDLYQLIGAKFVDDDDFAADDTGDPVISMRRMADLFLGRKRDGGRTGDLGRPVIDPDKVTDKP